MAVLAYLLVLVTLILNVTLFLNFKPPYNFMLLWIPQLAHHALSPFLVIIGLLGALLGLLAGAPLAVIGGLLGAGLAVIYIWRVLRARPEAAGAFRADGENAFVSDTAATMRKHGWRPGLPRTPEPVWERDIPFWTIPGSDRNLLCDVWQPAEAVTPSGLAVIYLHGSGWYLSDKDFGTRPFFRQLTAQGHVVMDVAYRLCPEVDIYGMVGDVKRAVAWMKANAARYAVDQQRIVLAGASAGGHLALLAAYAPDHPELTPDELRGCDLSVRAVISSYGPTDLRVVYDYTQQTRVLDLPKVEIGLPGSAEKETNFQDAGRLDTLLGGHLHEVPDAYRLASPIVHVHADCPPTLLIHGDLDCICPTSAIRELHQQLAACGVPVATIVYPRTQHAFDLVLPQVSPPAQAAIFETERFLAMVA